MKAVIGAFNQEKALAGAFSVIVKPMDRFTALVQDAQLCDGLRLVSVFQGVLEVVAAAIQTLFIHQLSIKVDVQF